MIKHECPTTPPPVREEEFLTGPPPLSQAEIDTIERTVRETPPGSDAETVLQLQEEVRFLLASPKDQDRWIENQRLKQEQLEAYLHWLKEETEALRFYNSSMEQWCRDHGWTEAELERERQSSHKKTANLTIVMSPTLRSSLEKIAQRHRVTIAAWARDVLHLTIVMSPTLRSSLEKIAQRHRVTIAAWARDVLHHAALEYYPESSE